MDTQFNVIISQHYHTRNNMRGCMFSNWQWVLIIVEKGVTHKAVQRCSKGDKLCSVYVTGLLAMPKSKHVQHKMVTAYVTLGFAAYICYRCSLMASLCVHTKSMYQ
jgi:hypothetical protein